MTTTTTGYGADQRVDARFHATLLGPCGTMFQLVRQRFHLKDIDKQRGRSYLLAFLHSSVDLRIPPSALACLCQMDSHRGDDLWDRLGRDHSRCHLVRGHGGMEESDYSDLDPGRRVREPSREDLKAEVVSLAVGLELSTIEVVIRGPIRGTRRGITPDPLVYRDSSKASWTWCWNSHPRSEHCSRSQCQCREFDLQNGIARPRLSGLR